MKGFAHFSKLLMQKSEDPSIRKLRSISKNPMAMIGIFVILFWILVALLAPIIAPYSPTEQVLEDRFAPPSAQNWFGRDEMGRDVLSRVIYGARISVPTGLIVIFFATITGSIIGALAGYVGGVVDTVFMRLADITMAFPPIVLAMAISAILGPGLTNSIIAVILVLWPAFSRLMRGQVLSVKNNEYVTAAVVVGVPNWKILFRHILINTFSPIITKASLDAGSVILFIASLSFIGLGTLPPTAEWGAMISTGRLKFYYWWLTTFPGLAILTVILGFNFIGDGIRDAFDPRKT